jgi:hypothetical protein
MNISDWLKYGSIPIGQHWPHGALTLLELKGSNNHGGKAPRKLDCWYANVPRYQGTNVNWDYWLRGTKLIDLK